MTRNLSYSIQDIQLKIRCWGSKIEVRISVRCSVMLMLIYVEAGWALLKIRVQVTGKRTVVNFIIVNTICLGFENIPIQWVHFNDCSIYIPYFLALSNQGSILKLNSLYGTLQHWRPISVSRVKKIYFFFSFSYLYRFRINENL